MKNIIYILLLSLIILSCTKLESMDYDLSRNCPDFGSEIMDSLSRMKMEGLHYVYVDTSECVLTVKYQKDKVDPNFFMDYLTSHEYHFIEYNVEEIEELQP